MRQIENAGHILYVLKYKMSNIIILKHFIRERNQHELISKKEIPDGFNYN